MNEKLDWELIVHYLSREATPEERQKIEERIASDPEFKTTIDNLRKIWQGPFEEKRSWNVDEAWEQYTKEFGDPYTETNKAHVSDFKAEVDKKGIPKKIGTANRTWIYRIGAVAAAAAAAILFVFLFYNPSTPGAESAQKEIVTKYGQRMDIKLSDGSNVTLNAGSKLVVPKQFDDSTREVTLVGEAYFDVASNADKPFLVHAKNGVTRVLGTRFTVQAYPEDQQVEVVVAEGKVALESTKEKSFVTSNTITKNQKGILNEVGTTTISQVSNLDSYLGWTKGKLVFEDASLTQIDHRLERWYDVNIRFDGSVPTNRHLTASFTTRQPLNEVLEAISLSLDLDYTKDDQVIIFHKN